MLTLAIIGFDDFLIYAAVSIAISIALSAVAAHLSAKDTFTGGKAKDATANLSLKGEYLPLVFGTRRLGCLIAWVGNTSSNQVRVADGARDWGLFGAKKGIYATASFSDAWHLICVGPVDRIEALFIDGKRILMPSIVNPGDGTLTSVTIPKPTDDGSTISVFGTVTIGWGGADQVLNDALAAELGIASIWPNVCYAHWQGVHMGNGSTSRWPKIEYVVSRYPDLMISQVSGDHEIPLDEVPFQTSTYESITKLTNTASCITTPAPDTSANLGLNPPFLLAVASCSTFPHGAGFVLEEEFYSPGLLAFSNECKSFTAELQSHVLIGKGDTLANIFDQILADCGVSLVDRGMLLDTVPIRAPYGDLEEATEDDITPPASEIVVDRSPFSSTSPVFIFSDEKDFEYADSDIGISNDTGAISNGVTSTKRVQLNTLTRIGTARVGAAIQSTGMVADTVIKLGMLRRFRQLSPGDVFNHPDNGILRVHSTNWIGTSPLLEIDASVDQYGLVNHSLVDPRDLAARLPASPDLALDFFFNRTAVPGVVEAWVFRVRAHDEIRGARLSGAVNGEAFVEDIHTENASIGGWLLQDLPAGGILTAGFKVQVMSQERPDSRVNDGAISWSTVLTKGAQYCMIGDELFAVAEISSVNNTTTFTPGMSVTIGVSGTLITAADDPTNYSFAPLTAGTAGSTAPTAAAVGKVIGAIFNDGAIDWRLGSIFEDGIERQVTYAQVFVPYMVAWSWTVIQAADNPTVYSFKYFSGPHVAGNITPTAAAVGSVLGAHFYDGAVTWELVAVVGPPPGPRPGCLKVGTYLRNRRDTRGSAVTPAYPAGTRVIIGIPELAGVWNAHPFDIGDTVEIATAPYTSTQLSTDPVASVSRVVPSYIP